MSSIIFRAVEQAQFISAVLTCSERAAELNLQLVSQANGPVDSCSCALFTAAAVLLISMSADKLDCISSCLRSDALLVCLAPDWRGMTPTLAQSTADAISCRISSHCHWACTSCYCHVSSQPHSLFTACSATVSRSLYITQLCVHLYPPLRDHAATICPPLPCPPIPPSQ